MVDTTKIMQQIAESQEADELSHLTDTINRLGQYDQSQEPEPNDRLLGEAYSERLGYIIGADYRKRTITEPLRAHDALKQLPADLNTKDFRATVKKLQGVTPDDINWLWQENFFSRSEQHHHRMTKLMDRVPLTVLLAANEAAVSQKDLESIWQQYNISFGEYVGLAKGLLRPKMDGKRLEGFSPGPHPQARTWYERYINASYETEEYAIQERHMEAPSRPTFVINKPFGVRR